MKVNSFDRMKWAGLIALAGFLSSAAFCLTDVATDSLLLKSYLDQMRFWKRCSDDAQHECWRGCWKNGSTNWQHCLEMQSTVLFRLASERDLYFAAATGTWLGLGGI